MTEPAAGDLAAWWADVRLRARDHEAAVHDAFQHLHNADLINRVVVHRFVCRRGCGVRATVIRIGDDVLMRTRDFKLSRGLNDTLSVESARRKNTLDGVRHWPGATFDVRSLAEWGPAASMDVACRHAVRAVRAIDVLSSVRGVNPGHPSAPTLL